MKREDLKALDLSDEVIDKIMAAYGRDVDKHKSAAETAKAEVDALKAQLGEANKTIEGFKKLDIDGIKAAADEWKAKAEKAQADADAMVTKIKFDHALERELKEAWKAKDPRDVVPHLRADKIQLDGDKFIGLEDQMKPLKESKGYLFEDVTEPPRIVTGGESKPINSTPFLQGFAKGAGLKEA